jgi:hypothetical protein
MARQPKLRKKKVGKSIYWFTKAGGDTYFGNIEDVTHLDARKPSPTTFSRYAPIRRPTRGSH